MLHVGRDKVYYLLRTGQLRSLKIGKLRRITEQQLAEFIGAGCSAAWVLALRLAPMCRWLRSGRCGR